MSIRTAIFVAAAHAALKSQVSKIDSLNVYPVPDGDTGTNMLLTLESVLRETSNESYETPEAASRAGSRAALMGARGNSGVILSQMIRGACEVLAKRASLSAEAFAAALEGARERAYSSLRQPVEGTMLTVVKDAARAAREALADETVDLPGVIKAAAREAHASVRRTPEMLGVLREAGVVDAGGLGVAVILDGLYSCITGKEVEVDTGETAVPELGNISHSPEEMWGYCTEFVVEGFRGDAEEFGDHIHNIGRSVLVIPDEDLVKVHLHTQDPGEALSYAGGYGRLCGVKVDDMEAQTRARNESLAGEGAAGAPAARVGVVAASRGAGSREMFESAGAVVVEGGQGANPSAADFARAVERTGARSVVLLPNNKNIVPTAEGVGELVEAEVYVVATTSIAGGLAALVGFDPEGEPEEVAEEMREIWGSLRCAEVTRAVRPSTVDGREIPEGAFIGLLDGELRAVEGGTGAAALALAREILEEGADIVTLLRGEELDAGAAEEIAAGIRELDGDVEVEVRDGGQPLYPLQMVAE